MAGKIIIFCMAAFLVASPVFAWKIDNQLEYNEETHYGIICDNGQKAAVKQMHPKDPKLMYLNGWWFIVGGGYFNYKSIEDAVKVACKYAK